MGTTAGGLPYPDGSDEFDPSGDMHAGFDAADVGRIIPVANTTERGTVSTGYSPTTSKPLYVHRADASTRNRLEVTVDGSTFSPVVGGDWVDYTPTVGGFAGGASYAVAARWTRIATTIHGRIYIHGGAGGVTSQITVSLPTATLAPPAVGIQTIGGAYAVPNGSARYIGSLNLLSTTSAGIYSSAGPWGSGVPEPWSSLALLTVEFTYGAA